MSTCRGAALACLAAALAPLLGCATGRSGREEIERIDAIVGRAGAEGERLAWEGMPPPAVPPNPTPSFEEKPSTPLARKGPSKLSISRRKAAKR